MLKRLFVMLSLFILASCGPQVEPTPTVESLAAMTLEPTDSPEPTVILEPTPTELPLCSVQAEKYLAEVAGLLERWRDASTLAAGTPSDLLTEPIAELQAVKRDVSGLVPPVCAEHLAMALIEAMESVIEVYLDHMSGKLCDAEPTVCSMFGEQGEDMLLERVLSEAERRWQYFDLSVGRLDEGPLNMVTYIVSGSSELNALTIQYTDETGSLIETGDLNGGDLPWERHIIFAASEAARHEVQLIAQGAVLFGGQSLTCKLYVNGLQVAAGEAETMADKAICNSALP